MSDAQHNAQMSRLEEVWTRINDLESAIEKQLIALNSKMEKFTSTNIAIMPCSCVHEVILGRDVIVIDKQCGVHGGTAQ
jgi:hypothetical protein